MKKVFIGALAGGVASFIWGMACWMFVGLYDSSMSTIPEQDTVRQAFKTAQVETGTYYIPGWPDDHTDAAQNEAFEARHIEGPLAMIFYNAEGREMNMATNMGRGFVVNLLAAGIIAYLLWLAAPSLPSYFHRLFFVVCIGVVVSLMGPVMNWNWFYYPTDYTIANIADIIIGTGVLGLVLAAIVKK